MKNSKKGFTLLELLIVIGILAILATVAIIIINPAELLRRSRDSARISDLSSLKSAIGMYLTDVASADLDSNYVICYDSGVTTARAVSSIASTTAGQLGTGGRGTNCNVGANSNVHSSTSSNQTLTNGMGWIPVNFDGMSTGSPLGSLPIDPVNACANSSPANQLYYTYSCSATPRLTFLLTARMESSYYGGNNPTNPIQQNDGGTATSVYETGTKFDILLGDGTAAGATTSYGVL